MLINSRLRQFIQADLSAKKRSAEEFDRIQNDPIRTEGGVAF